VAESPLVKDLLARFHKLKTQRQTWESHWQEVADYMLPRKADVTKQRSKGDKRSELIFDSSPLHAVELLSASLHGMLTNPSVPWFSLKFKNIDFVDALICAKCKFQNYEKLSFDKDLSKC